MKEPDLRLTCLEVEDVKRALGAVQAVQGTQKIYFKDFVAGWTLKRSSLMSRSHSLVAVSDEVTCRCGPRFD